MTTPTPAELADDWLVRQLEAWPTRIDPEKTINIEYLMKAAASEIRSLRAEGWQPISTAPKDGTRILAIWLYRGVDNHRGSQTHEVVRWCGWWDANGITMPEPTHWRHLDLPLPPEN